MAMILKKPYAFLIKHFKLVHFVLFGLASFFAYKVAPIVSFFRDYVDNNYSTKLGLDALQKFVPFYIIIIAGVLFVINTLIMFLLSNKSKKIGFYLFYALYFIGLVIALFNVDKTLVGIASSPMNVNLARIYRDMSLILLIPVIVFAIVALLRSMGFNVSQFHLGDNYRDLTITEEDNAEVEVSIGIETYKTARGFRRFIREFKYYWLENKLMVIILILFLLGIGGYFIYSGIENKTISYKIGDTVQLSSMSLTLDDVILTNLDAGGNTISTGKYYVVLRVIANNNTSEEQKLDYNIFKVYFGNQEHVDVGVNLGKYFLDYGQPVSNAKVSANSSSVFALAYELTKEQASKALELRFNTGIVSKKDSHIVKTGIIKIYPIVISEVKNVGSINKNTTLNLSGTHLLKTTFAVSDYLITDRYMYTYTSCVTDNINCHEYKDIIGRESSSELIFVLNGKLTLDKDSAFAKNSNAQSKFGSTFFKAEYTKDGVTKISSLSNVTPKSFTNGYIFKVSSGIENADKINLLVTIRDKRYRIALKS
jgi:hypothetical protein